MPRSSSPRFSSAKLYLNNIPENTSPTVTSGNTINLLIIEGIDPIVKITPIIATEDIMTVVTAETVTTAEKIDIGETILLQ